MLIGDANETSLADKIIQNDIKRIHSSVGHTSIQELTTILGNSSLFIGLDGGPMHIAVSLGIPTFTIWGGSNHNMYGYEKINLDKHKIVRHDLPCHPCNSYLNPNTSKTDDPLNCPDFACLQNITPQLALEQFKEFINQLNL